MPTFLQKELLFVHPIIQANDALIESAQVIKQKSLEAFKIFA